MTVRLGPGQPARKFRRHLRCSSTSWSGPGCRSHDRFTACAGAGIKAAQGFLGAVVPRLTYALPEKGMGARAAALQAATLSSLVGALQEALAAAEQAHGSDAATAGKLRVAALASLLMQLGWLLEEEPEQAQDPNEDAAVPDEEGFDGFAEADTEPAADDAAACTARGSGHLAAQGTGGAAAAEHAAPADAPAQSEGRPAASKGDAARSGCAEREAVEAEASGHAPAVREQCLLALELCCACSSLPAAQAAALQAARAALQGGSSREAGAKSGAWGRACAARLIPVAAAEVHALMRSGGAALLDGEGLQARACSGSADGAPRRIGERVYCRPQAGGCRAQAQPLRDSGCGLATGELVIRTCLQPPTFGAWASCFLSATADVHGSLGA